MTMTKVSFERKASVEEIANEMDRRGTVIENLEASIAELERERNAHKAKSLSRGRLLERFRGQVQEICDHVTDEGDRRYFGSTNHVDTLRDIADQMDRWNWDRIIRERPEGDPYADLRAQRSRAEAAEARVTDLEARLRTAEAALERQADNMAFVINHATLPDQWQDKFMRELDEDRTALAAVKGGRE